MRMVLRSFAAGFERQMRDETDRFVRQAKRALGELAWLSVERVRDQMRRDFNLPTDYIQQGMTVEYARGSSNTATIDWMKPASKRSGPGAGRVLKAQIEGGRRRDKRLDAALRFLGLPKGLMAVPGKHAKLDRSGDMDGQALRRILADLKAQGPALKRRHFVVMNRDGKTKIPRGIYERHKDGNRLIVAFVPDGSYTPRFNPVAVVGETVRRERAAVWRDALAGRLPDRTSRGNVRA